MRRYWRRATPEEGTPPGSMHRWWLDRSVRSKGLTVVAVPLIALIGVASASLALQGSESQKRTVATADHTLSSTGSTVLAGEVNADTGVRGYAATGDGLFLALDTLALTRMPRTNAHCCQPPSSSVMFARLGLLLRQRIRFSPSWRPSARGPPPPARFAPSRVRGPEGDHGRPSSSDRRSHRGPDRGSRHPPGQNRQVAGDDREDQPRRPPSEYWPGWRESRCSHRESRDASSPPPTTPTGWAQGNPSRRCTGRVTSSGGWRAR